MIKLKFNEIQVTFENGKIQTEDDFTYRILSPLINSMSGGPEDGHPLLNLLVSIFGRESVTDIEFDDDPNIIY